jgi:hypothetical protein
LNLSDQAYSLTRFKPLAFVSDVIHQYDCGKSFIARLKTPENDGSLEI